MRIQRATFALVLGCLPVVAACGDDGGDGDVAAFCEADAAINSADPFATASAEEAEQVTNEMREAFAAGRAAAPEEVAADVERIGDVFVSMLDALEAADFDTSAVDPEQIFADSAEADPEFEPALERVEAFSTEECAG